MGSARAGSPLILAALLLAVSLAMLEGCAPAPESAPPNIILISIDTLRADRLGSYGYAAETSPTLDGLARQGVRFANAISQSNWTLPAHMSLFTSQHVATHGIVDDRTALSEEALTLTEVLAGQGYKTAAFASWVYLNPRFGFEQGFDEYYLQLDPERISLADGGGAFNASEVVDAAEHWLAKSKRSPYLLFVHFFDPHLGYSPPPPYDQLFTQDYSGPIDGSYDQIKTRILGLNENVDPIDAEDLGHLDALYQGEIRFVDDQIKRLLEAVDSRSPLEDCLVVVVADHGEELGDHGSLEGHGWTMYEEVVRVPMIWRFPGLAFQGTVVQEPVGLIDVGPTILDFLGIEPPEPFQGRSLLHLVDAERPTTDSRPVLSDSGGRLGIFMRAARGPRFKLIETRDTGKNQFGIAIQAGYELYDLASDPQERLNIFHPDHPAAQRLLRALESEDRHSGRPVAEPDTQSLELSDEEKKMLRSLGYIQ